MLVLIGPSIPILLTPAEQGNPRAFQPDIVNSCHLVVSTGSVVFDE